MANEIYNTTWWGNAIDTAITAGTEPDFFGSQMKMLTSQQPELVVNGDFATDTDWSKGTGWSISGGVSTANNVPNLQRLQNTGNAPSVIGSTYKYSIDVSNVSGFYSFYIFGVYALSTVNTEGTIEGYVTATSTNGAIFVAAASAGGLISATIDNVSVTLARAEEVEAVKCLADWIHTTALQDLNN